MKRHDKPFWCTSDGCNKSFGSKNDWKRHENSQHFQLEVWRCDQGSKSAGSMLCRKVYHRREVFRTHLQRDHGIQSTAEIDGKLDRCRVGRSCEARFWCGFCKHVVEIKEKGPPAWTARFNHIYDHYSKEKRLKDDWQSFDERRAAAAEFPLASASTAAAGEKGAASSAASSSYASPSSVSSSSSSPSPPAAASSPPAPTPAAANAADVADKGKRKRSLSADDNVQEAQPQKKQKVEYLVTCVSGSLFLAGLDPAEWRLLISPAVPVQDAV